MVNFPATADSDTTLFLAKNLKTTTLSGAHTNSVTTLTVASTTGFPTAGWLRLEEPTSGVVELVSYTGTDATHFNGVTRGADADFPAQAHSNGATVTLAVVSAHHNGLKDTIVSMQTWAGVLGTMVHSVVTGSSYTVLTTDAVIPVDATSNAITINLFTAVSNKGRVIYIYRVDGTQNVVTIDPNSTQTIDGMTTMPLRPGDAMILISDGANWLTIGANMRPGGFEAADSGSATAFTTEGILWWDAATTISGVSTQVGSSTTTAQYAQGTFVQSVAGGTASTVDLVAGTVIEYVSAYSTTNLGSANTSEMGVCLTNVAPAAATFSTTTATMHCVVVGFDTDGVFKILTSNGSTKTVTTTGITGAINTRYKIKIVWTVGTNVVVTIDNNAPITVTSTLPTRMTWHGAAKAATGVAATAIVYGGAWRVTMT